MTGPKDMIIPFSLLHAPRKGCLYLDQAEHLKLAPSAFSLTRHRFAPNSGAEELHHTSLYTTSRA